MKVLRLVLILFLILVIPYASASAQTVGESGAVDDFIQLFLSAAVGGVPLMAVVYFLVEGVKSFKKADGTQAVNGNALTITSICIGFVLGNLWMIYKTRPPTDGDWYAYYGYWFGVEVYAVALGGLTSYGYNKVKALSERSVVKVLGGDVRPGPG